MNVENTRIQKLREYLFNVIDTISSNTNYQINANMLSNKIDDYSLDKIPTNTDIETWIIGVAKKQDIYSFRSRRAYSQDTIINLNNIGFFEKFEQIINSNNKQGILPDIENIESIECLNCGTLNHVDSNMAEFDIQIQITYIEGEENRLSL